jgi:polyferredoxin
MDKMGYARGLIRYSTEHAMQQGLSSAQTLKRAFRPRVLVYSAILWIVIIATAASVWLRVPLKVDVIRDRAAIAREVEGGKIENVFRLQIMNTSEQPRRFAIAAEGLPTLALASPPEVDVPGASTIEVPVRLRIDAGAAAAGTHRIEFEVRALGDSAIKVEEKSVFIVR